MPWKAAPCSRGRGGGDWRFADAADADNLRRFEQQAAVDPKHRMLLKGGTIISMDDKIGDLVQGDRS